jgi:DNA-binding XRE family transcriptional regulator
MADIAYRRPAKHQHAAFLKKANKRAGFKAAYEALANEYAVANDAEGPNRAGLTQEAVASLMGTSKSTISRLEAAGRHSPSLSSLQKYAEAVGCKLQVKLVPMRQASACAANTCGSTARHSTTRSAHSRVRLKRFTL